MSDAADAESTAPGDRMRSAAALLDSLAGESSALPWTYYEDHGRDYTDEGWSHVGLVDANGLQHVHTHAPGYEGNRQPEIDAALIAVLSACPVPLAHLLREMADHHDTDPADGTCNAAAAALADFILDRVTTHTPET